MVPSSSRRGDRGITLLPLLFIIGTGMAVIGGGLVAFVNIRWMIAKERLARIEQERLAL